MRVSKIDMALFIKTKLPKALYIASAIIVLVPLFIVMIGYGGFSKLIANLLVRGALLMIGTGKLIEALEKDKEDVTRSISIGFALGIYIAALLIYL